MKELYLHRIASDFIFNLGVCVFLVAAAALIEKQGWGGEI
jgi:hypothetical protein